MCIEFRQEPEGEIILKIGLHLPKLLTKIKGVVFFKHVVDPTSAKLQSASCLVDHVE